MPRRTNRDITRIHISLPTGDLALLDQLLHDHRTSKPKYGARAKLIEALLSRFLLAVREGRANIKVKDLLYILE